MRGNHLAGKKSFSRKVPPAAVDSVEGPASLTSPPPSPPSSAYQLPLTDNDHVATDVETCDYEAMLQEQPTSHDPGAVYGGRADGLQHASPRVVAELIQAERAWACACASSMHLAKNAKRQSTILIL